MRIREPVVAGTFYDADPEACRRALVELLNGVAPPPQGVSPAVAGLVPHAGWTYSGRVAAGVFSRLAGGGSPPAVIIVFGGVHRFRGRRAAVFASGRWETPLGSARIDARFAERVMGHTNLIVDDPFAHEDEHSIEVQLPFLVHLFPEAEFVPIMVPPVPIAHEVGDAVARTIQAYDYNALIVGTTDLTHYGPDYGFVPRGIGKEGTTWAKEQNDRRFLDLVCAMKAEDVVPEAARHRNACSAGAVAATLAAASALGATRGRLLEHTNSAEVAAKGRPAGQDNSVGYAGLVFE